MMREWRKAPVTDSEAKRERPVLRWLELFLGKAGPSGHIFLGNQRIFIKTLQWSFKVDMFEVYKMEQNNACFLKPQIF